MYLPLLDAGLAPAEAEEMFRAMHESARASGLAHRPPDTTSGAGRPFCPWGEMWSALKDCRDFCTTQGAVTPWCRPQ